MQRKINIVIIITALMLNAVVFADTTYIASKGAAISSQFSKLHPGDTLLIMPGTYNYISQCWTIRDGTPDKPIVARAASPNTVFIKHTNEEEFVVAHRYLIVENLNLSCYGSSSHHFKCNSNNPTSGQYLQIRNCVLTGFGESLIKAGDLTVGLPSVIYPGDFLLIEGCEITSDSLGLYGNGNGFNLDGPDNCVIRNNWIHDLERTQGSSAGDPTYSGFFKGGCQNEIIEGNIFGPGAYMRGFCFGGGCMLTHYRDERTYETDNVCYRNNILVNLPYVEFDCGDNPNSKVYHNTIINCAGTITASDVRNNLILGGTATAGSGSNNYKGTYSSAYFWDPANRNYALKTTATALIGKVARMDSVLTDKLGTARPGMVSYGAYEAYDVNPVAAESQGNTLPEVLGMDIQPNPVTSGAVVDYRLAVPMRCVEIGVYDLSGRTVRVLFYGTQAAGEYSLRWNGRGHTEAAIASGVYILRIRAGERQCIRQFIKIQ
ncbi:MAG: FlgD immunoglobulin-like domain containing protein [Fibrobacterota bacterium]